MNEPKFKEGDNVQFLSLDTESWMHGEIKKVLSELDRDGNTMYLVYVKVSKYDWRVSEIQLQPESMLY